MSIIRCGFIGALVAGIVAVCVYFLFDVFTPNERDGVKGWEEITLMVQGLWGIFGGFVLGAIYGAIRTLMNRKREEKGNGTP